MVPRNMKVNKKLLPIKGHFFLFNAGTAPLVPYLPTYARQLGFSSASVGLIYTVLPIFGLIAKPLFGVIADRFKIQKSIFIIFQIVIIVSFFSIQLIPENNTSASAQLDCGDGATFLRSCFPSESQLDKSTISAIGNMSSTATCQMNCDMSTPKMWQTVCEHWHLPQYCYSNTNNIQYRANVANVSVVDKCAYVHTNNVTLGEYTYTPQCHVGGGYIDINLPCRLNCTNHQLANALASQQANMTCVNKQMSYRVCPKDPILFADLKGTSSFEDCQASCDLNEETPWQLMEICEGWQADAATPCRPKTKLNQHYPTNLTFTGAVLMNTMMSVKNCAFVQLNHIVLDDGSSHYPRCVPKSQYESEAELFRTSCRINCNNKQLNQVFRETSEENSADYTKQFWLFFMLMIISWIGQAVVVTFADAICFNLLDKKVSHYGKQRLWGSVGFGILSLVTGALIDMFSDGAYKNYVVAFALMFVFMSGDVIVSCFVKNESTRMSVSILADVGSLLSSLPTFIFMLWTIAVGLCTALIWNFLFWHIEVISETYDEGFEYTKTLQGLVSAIQTFGGEIPFLFVSGYVLRKLGHINMMSLVLFAFGVRFILYSFVQNPWWVLPIELFQGITFGMFYPTMTSYATVVSPPGTETTVQGLVGAVFEGVGTSLGSYIGGRLINVYGGWLTFRWFGIGSLVFCAIHIVAQHLLKNRMQLNGLNQGYTSIIKYEQPNDSVHILEEEDG